MRPFRWEAIAYIASCWGLMYCYRFKEETPMKSKLTKIALLSFLILLLIPHSMSAEIKSFVKEYTYHAGDEDSRNSCRIIALREVKRLLLEELGTYLESKTEVKDFQMTKDQITTLTAGIVSAEVIEDKWDGKTYWLKAKVDADPQDVIKSIANLRKDSEKVKELERLRKKSEELLQENKRLNKELMTATDGKKQEAAKAYKRNIDNLSATEWFEEGYLLLVVGQGTDAMSAFNKAVKLNPRDPKTYHYRAQAHEKVGNYHQAIEDYSRVVELDPLAAEAYYRRGIAYDAIANGQQATKDYNKAIELNPEYSKWHLTKTDSNPLRKGSLNRIKKYNKAIELKPRDAEAYYRRGVDYGYLGNHHQKIKDLSKAIELGRQDSMTFLERGSAYNSLDNYEQAIENFNKAIELEPVYPWNEIAYSGRGDAYAKLGKYQHAIKDFSKAIELNLQYPVLYYRDRGLAYDKLGNHHQAIKDFKTAAKLGDADSQHFLRSKGIEW